jgi:signal recognition particle subunit SEC65
LQNYKIKEKGGNKMFVEVTKKQYEKMKKMLQEMGIKIEVSDCTLPKDKEQMVHIEVMGLTEKQKEQINEIFGIGTIMIDRDADGRDDKLEELEEDEERPRVVRRRKSDQKFQGPIKGAIDDFTGKNREEEIIYENR